MSWFLDLIERCADRPWTSCLAAGHARWVAEEQLRETNEFYAAARDRLLAADPLPVLRKSLSTGRHLLTTLHLLREVGAEHPQVVRGLVPELYECCLSVNKPGIFGREILRTLSRTVDLHDDLAPLVSETLEDETELNDSLAMGALATLLEDVGATALMGQWRRAVLTSSDPDVRELAEDFPAED